MALLDLQTMEPEERTGGGDDSSASLLLCDKLSSHSALLCLCDRVTHAPSAPGRGSAPARGHSPVSGPPAGPARRAPADRLLLAAGRSHLWRTLALFATATGAALAALALPAALGRTLDLLLAGEAADGAETGRWLACCAALTAVSVALDAADAVLTGTLNSRTTAGLRTRLAGHLLAAGDRTVRAASATGTWSPAAPETPRTRARHPAASPPRWPRWSRRWVRSWHSRCSTCGSRRSSSPAPRCCCAAAARVLPHFDRLRDPLPGDPGAARRAARGGTDRSPHHRGRRPART